MLVIKFKHNYFKLGDHKFTTIRGKSWYKKIDVGDTVELHTPTGIREAKVVKVELKRIDKMLLSQLKKDGEYPGFKIENSLQFVSLLNSFRRPMWTSKPVAPDDEMTVITLQQ